MPNDPAAIVRALRACRTVMIDVCRTVKPFGPAYHGASMVIASIDGLVTFLTGQQDYFHRAGSGATEGQVAAAESQAARERGDELWK
jgi:hypothetical protein